MKEGKNGERGRMREKGKDKKRGGREKREIKWEKVIMR